MRGTKYEKKFCGNMQNLAKFAKENRGTYE